MPKRKLAKKKPNPPTRRSNRTPKPNKPHEAENSMTNEQKNNLKNRELESRKRYQESKQEYQEYTKRRRMARKAQESKNQQQDSSSPAPASPTHSLMGLLNSNMSDADLNQDSFDTNYDNYLDLNNIDDLNDIDMTDWALGSDEEIERELEEIERDSKKNRKDVHSAPTAKGKDTQDFVPEDLKHTPPPGMHEAPLMQLTEGLRAFDGNPPAEPGSTPFMRESNEEDISQHLGGVFGTCVSK